MEALNKLLTVISVNKSSDKKSAKIIQQVNNTQGIVASIETGRYFRDGENIICISSAIGCMHGCTFCATTKPHEYEKDKPVRFLRFLTSEEVVEQVLNSIRVFPLLTAKKEGILFSYMGMGEPFDNIDEIKKSISTLGSFFSNSRATLSTIARQPNQIRKFANEVALGEFPIPVKLHVSLHGSYDEQRRKLIPYSSTIQETIESANYFASKTGYSVKLNYVLLKNVNNSPDDANRIGQLLKGNSRLILKISDLNSINKNTTVADIEADKFEQIVKGYGVRTCRFSSLGQDIAAGCGELVKRTYKSN